MNELAYKVRISVLWLMHIIAFLVYRTLAVGEGASEVSILDGVDLAPYVVGMMLFAFLSLVLPYRVNRSMNIIAASVVAATQIIMLVDGMVGYPSSVFNVMTGLTILIMIPIIWFAARWPKPQA